MEGKDLDLCPDSLGISAELVTNTLGCPQGVPEPQGSVWAPPPALVGQGCSRGGTQECLRGAGRDIWFARALNINICLIPWAAQEFSPQLWCGDPLLHSSALAAPGAQSCVCCGVLWAARPSNLPGRSSASLCLPKPLVCTPALHSPTFYWGVCRVSWMNTGSTLSGSRETPELHNTRMATMKFLCVGSRVFHPGVLKDSWKTI